MHDTDHMDGSGWAVMGFWVLLALLGLFVLAAVQWTHRTSAAPAPPAQTADHEPTQTAGDLPDERLARGDLGVDEYGQRRAVTAHARRPSR
jgi:uncharacterized membrane protein